jgi:GntR family transcriptional regulator
MPRKSALSPLVRNPLSPSLYKEAKLRMTEGLRAGEWRVGEALPSEARLAARFHISVGTLRKAVAELVAEGLLIRHQGRGTYVAAHNASRLFHFFRIVPKKGDKLHPLVKLQSFRRSTADAVTRERLGLDRGDAVYRIEDLLYLSSRPVVLDFLVLPTAIFPGLTKDRFRDRESTIYGLYQSRFDINVVRTVERLNAVSADRHASRTLEVAIGSPLLRVERIAYTFDNRPVELRTRFVDTREFDYLSDLDK